MAIKPSPARAVDSAMFATDYNAIIAQIDQLDAVRYASTRNYLNGAVTRLSPYLSRGVITLPLVRDRILARYTKEQAHSLLFELAWREYFQRVWWQHGDGIYTDMKQPQQSVAHHSMPSALADADTGITAIDTAIEQLYSMGYMHNHARMYIASIATNVGQAHWLQPSRWLYYHLLDHDLASNMLSWQWVAGTFSSKKYYANQENINKYSATNQFKTFLDFSYDQLPRQPIPRVLLPTVDLKLKTTLPTLPAPNLDPSLPLYVYNSYHLDPSWDSDIAANRLLLLEPSHFNKYPVSGSVLSFILSLSQNIKGMQVLVGEVADIPHLGRYPVMRSLDHPAFVHYPGEKIAYPWLFSQVRAVKGSFMGYWKQCEKYL